MGSSSSAAKRWSSLPTSACNRQLHCRFLRTSQEIHHRTGWHSLRSQHLEQQGYDKERTKYLEPRGYRVLRFWNHDVMNNTETVLQVIWNAMNDKG
ncbi:MAG: DUF559 domain-containing protein [Chloroflexota bacterium]